MLARKSSSEVDAPMPGSRQAVLSIDDHMMPTRYATTTAAPLPPLSSFHIHDPVKAKKRIGRRTAMKQEARKGRGESREVINRP